MKLKYCVYAHYRPNGDVFYIGKAILNGNHYRRAYTKYKRNDIWNKIVSKNNNLFLVKELYYSDNEEECLNVESQFIRKFGCLFDGSGILANLEERSGSHISTSKMVYEVNENGNIINTYNSVATVSRQLNCDPGIIANVCRRRSKGLNVSYKTRKFTYCPEIVPIIETRSKLISRINKTPIFAERDNEFLEFDSIKSCSNELGLSVQCIIRNLQNKTISRSGWFFKKKVANKKSSK